MESTIIEVVVGIGPRLAKCIFGYIESHYTSKVANLRAQVGELNNATQNMRDRVAVAEGNGEVIDDEVQRWLESATEISRRAEGFLNVNQDRANVSCCNVQIPNLLSRRKLSREARLMIKDLLREIQAAQEFDVVASRPALHTNIAMRGDYKDLESRKMILVKIMKELQDRNVSRIGIYGIGGIGKTTLAKEVARQAVETKLFTEVAMTTVSQTQDSSRLQQEIAEKIKLNIDGLHTVSARADRLQRRLKEEKSILIILDDIWEKLNLIEVGIHLENEGCKILMTSRSQDVLRSMDADKNFPVDDLSASEAMNLFRTIVGDIVDQRDFNRLAIDVVRECGGLPLAITVVAGSLKNKNKLVVWRDTLNQLRSIISPTNIAEPLREVYRSIRLSYDSLADEDKSLLLLCSLYGEDTDIEVEDLRMIGVGRGLFQNVSSLADARTRVESLVVKLKDRCLLLAGDDDDDDWVKMHDVIRDVAVSIASNEGGMHSVTINELEDCQNKKKLKDSKAISLLRHPEFNQLPERLECSELELFLLHSGQGDPIPIQNHFFEESKDQLKSLFLYEAKLVAVPSSFHLLQNLQTLCLRGCVLEDVTFIGDLKNLQILDLSESTIKQLPVKVAQLSRLQLLNLERCKDLKLIEPDVISSLIQLEELYISEYFDKWEVGEVDVSRRSNVNLAEIENLKQLTSLSLKVPDAKTFPKDFKFSEMLERYTISIGDSLDYLNSTGISRSLRLKLHERSQLTALGLESLMKRSEGLFLAGLIDVKNVVYDLDSEGFCDLKRLDLKNSDGVQYIVDCVDHQIHPHEAFPVLESLRLEGLRNLERIYHGELPEDSFKNLREVRVGRCEKLKNVFPLSIFKRLRSIEVYDCKMMEEIVGHVRSEDDGAVEFPELRSLKLRKLPKMVKFMSWSEAEAAGGSSLVESPDPLFGEKVALPSLEDLHLNNLVVKKLWADQIPASSYMQNLSSLRVRDCGNLKYVSSFATAKSCLIKLKRLEVSRCSVLEEVLVIMDLQGEDHGSLEKILVQLKSLELDDLPNLKRFCKHPDELKTLITSIKLTGEGSEHEEVEFGIGEPLFSEMVELPSLEDLTMNKLGAKMLWADQLASTSYVQNLSSLCVRDCGNLKYVSSFATAKSCLIKLKRLEVSRCSVLEEVLVITDLQGEDDGSLEKIWLRQLKSLTLDDLPNLKRFCKHPDELKTLVTSIKLTGEGSEHEEVEFGAEEPLFSEMVALPSLEDLHLNKLIVKKLWVDQIPTTSYMPNLSTLDVRDCNNLKYVSSFATAKSCLIKLKELEVYECSVLEEVLAITDLQGQDDGSLEKISLPQLKSLTLDDLPNLKRFCKRLDEVKTLVTTTELTGEGSEHEEVEFGAEEPFFSEMVELPSLEDLTLNKLGVKMFWADQLASTSYMQNLSSLCVRDCGNLKYVSSFATAKSCLIKLKQLEVYKCSVLEEVLAITDLQGQDDGSLEKILLPQLKSLTLWNLPYLKRFCKNPHELKMLETNSMSTEITVDRAKPEEMKFSANESLFNEMLEFPGLETLDLYGLNAVESVWQLQTTCYMVNLTSLSVRNCKSLKCLLSLAVAERLVKLKRLQVKKCIVIEDIVVTNKLGEEGRSRNKILFPQLEYLMLSKLPALRKFCHEEVILPKLETLSTDWSEAITEMLGTNQSSSTLSLCHRQLKELKLDFSYQDKPFALSICKLLRRCHNLEKLKLNGLLVNEDRQNEVGAAAREYDGRLITCLRELRLDNVPKLRHLFSEPENDHPVGRALQPVKTLFVSLQNLTILEVSFCHRLTYLLASSTATSLVQLKQMSVTDCNRMTEIITDYREGEITEGEHDREFVFPQLEILVLRHLPNLGSFFSGNNVMRFPKMEKLFVSQCPEMRSFSHGIIISSMLNTIITEIDNDLFWRYTYHLMNHAKAVREHWDGDVNTTVRQLREDDSDLALQQLFAET